jgi:hypothetical protein
MMVPGKYDKLCSYVRTEADAHGAVVIIFGGNLGTGFSCEAESDVVGLLPEILRAVADEIERTAANEIGASAANRGTNRRQRCKS